MAPLRALLLFIVLFDLYLFSRHQSFRFPEPASIVERGQGPVWKYFGEDAANYKVFRQMDEVPYNTDNNDLRRYRDDKALYTGLQARRLQPNLNLLDRVQVTSGYEEGLLPTISYMNSIGENPATGFMGQYHRNLYNRRPDTALMGLLNIKYIMTDKPLVSDRLKPVFTWVDVEAVRDLLKARTRRLSILSEHPNNEGKNKKSLAVLVQEKGRQLASVTDANSALAALGSDAERRLFLTSVYENLDFVPKFVWGKQLRAMFDLDVMDVSSTRLEKMRPKSSETQNFDYRLNPTSATIAPSVATLEQLYVQKPFGSPNNFLVQKPKSYAGEIIMIESAQSGLGMQIRFGNAASQKGQRLHDGVLCPCRRIQPAHSV